MDARIAGQLGGIGHLILTRGESLGADTRTQSVDAVKRAPDPSDASPAQADLADTNGDGTVEPWSYAHGGDSVTTFKPPPAGAVGANGRKVGRPPRGSAPPPAPTQGAHHANAHGSTAAAVHHAHEAYQRDGGANPTDATAPATTAGATPDVSAAPSPPATPSTTPAPVPQTDGSAPVIS